MTRRMYADEALDDALASLAALWKREADTVRQRSQETRARLSLAERVERGMALTDLRIAEISAAPGDRTMLWLTSRSERDLGRVRLRPGHPVVLWWTRPDDPNAAHGTVARWRSGLLGVMIDGDPHDALETGGFHLDIAEPLVTFKRGDQAIAAARAAARSSDLGRLVRLCFGDGEPVAAKAPAWTPRDEALHEAQREAVSLTLASEDVALIHGPPGTGKTRTLVEVIAQAVARGERVLACAASNMAVDNLAARLINAGLEVVRVGHPARVHDDVIDRALDTLLEDHPLYDMASGWLNDSNAARRKAQGTSDRATRRDLYREANSLARDARRYLRFAPRDILSRAQVVATTTAGAADVTLDDLEFDLLVLDEATQSPDPLTLIPMQRVKRMVLAGDPHQLAPTVIDPQAEREGLGETIFARLAAARPELCRMLTRQHRMHEAIMAFPNAKTYGGHLIAADEVAHHRLEDLGAQPDPLRDSPLVFIDTAGKGWEDERGGEDDDDPSTSNPQQAERTAAEVRRLISRGVSPRDVGLISPYRAQLQRLEGLLQDLIDEGLELSSVDGFQGREKEAIVLDLVRSNDTQELGFLRDVRRTNVAITRARRFLLILGDSATLTALPYYAELFDAVGAHGLWGSAWSDEAEPL